MHEFPRAEKRPNATGFQVAEHTLASVRRTTIDAPAPSRIIYTTRLPAHGVLRTDVAVLPGVASDTDGAVRFRIGISDGRVYEARAEQLVTIADTKQVGWRSVTVDMSLYGGRQWSLFYRPSRRAWQLIFNADQVAGHARALWGSPGVDTNRASAESWWQEGRK